MRVRPAATGRHHVAERILCCAVGSISAAARAVLALPRVVALAAKILSKNPFGVDPVSWTREGFRRPAAKGWCPTCLELDPDDDLRLQFEAITRLTDDEKQTVKRVLEGLLIAHNVKHDATRWAA